jgi:hypothetical protein
MKELISVLILFSLDLILLYVGSEEKGMIELLLYMMEILRANK